MSEGQCSKSTAETKVNNEDIINELTKDIEESLTTNDNTETNDFTHPDFKLPNSSEHKFNDDFDKEEKSKSDEENDTDDDEEHLKDLELSLSQSEKEDRQLEAELHKNEGNAKFKIGEYEESLKFYTKGLKVCPLIYHKDRAMLYSNRAATKMKLKKDKEAIKDCTKAIENDPEYIKAYFRRAQCYEATDSLDDSFADFKKILELEPSHPEARKAVVRLPPLIEERNERLKTEMMSKLKDLGNLVLKPFGLSTENFKLSQDPESKGYSINFQQNK